MNEARFEAVYDEGEMGERSPEWKVVEWTAVHPNGARSGRCVESWMESSLGAEEKAKELAWVLQEEYNREFFQNFG